MVPNTEVYDAIDIDENKICKARLNSRVKFTCFDFLQFESEIKYDTIIFSLSFHMISEFEEAHKKAKNMLSRGGVLIIIEPLPEPRNWKCTRLNKMSGDCLPNPEFNEKIFERKFKILKGIEAFCYGVGMKSIVSQKNITFFSLS